MAKVNASPVQQKGRVMASQKGASALYYVVMTLAKEGVVMNLLRFIFSFTALLILHACGDHGYEGQYRLAADRADGLIGSMASVMGVEEITIGHDFVEANGSRQVYDDIFVRDSGDRAYLVFKRGESEEAWRIKGKDTLVQGNQLMRLEYTRVH
ncbi:MAG: hypothetical protein ACPHBL_00865 [Spongiibacter marinus]|uniref:hypothetical protein n=1 Tax=Spongiibacter TaxID=630749 RepID=UPI00257F5855|nr:hypothetical protein [Spongiibacter sp.]